MRTHWLSKEETAIRKPSRIVWFGILLVAVGVLVNTGCDPNPQSQGTPNSVESVGLITAKQALDRDQAVFLDVRNSYQFADSHIPGAISIPLDALESRIGELNASWWILIYCDCPDEKEAREAAQFLLQSGFENVNPVIGGFQGWISSGYPVEP